jgi:ribonuclease-3
MQAKDRQVLDHCQQRLGYRFRNLDLLRAALTHASSADTRQESYERMEFLGDAVLGLVVCQVLYERLPDAMEGELTKIKSAVVSRRICALVADQLQLSDALRLGQGIDSGEHLPRSLAAAALEAVIAAIYLDGGLEAARELILREMDDAIGEAIRSEHQSNYKAHLQQHAQRKFGASPRYEVLDEKGPDHAKCFEVAVSIAGRQYPSAWAPSKKEAEQKAAHAALVALGVLAAETSEDEAHDD